MCDLVTQIALAVLIVLGSAVAAVFAAITYMVVRFMNDDDL